MAVAKTVTKSTITSKPRAAKSKEAAPKVKEAAKPKATKAASKEKAAATAAHPSFKDMIKVRPLMYVLRSVTDIIWHGRNVSLTTRRRPALVCRVPPSRRYVVVFSKCFMLSWDVLQYISEKYKLDLENNAANASHLNRAITSGEKDGIFVLPKGPSGKVKLPPKNKPAANEVGSPTLCHLCAI